MDKVHGKAMRIFYGDYQSSFQNHLEKDNSYAIYQKKLPCLVTKILKVKMGLLPLIMTQSQK